MLKAIFTLMEMPYNLNIQVTKVDRTLESAIVTILRFNNDFR
jgi:hypothetical protein